MKRLVLFLALILTFNAKAEKNYLEEFYTQFKTGKYQKAIDALEKLSVEQNSLSSKYYLTALSYARLQEYDKAIPFFEKAIAEKSEAKDIYYEYGQALYANNNLKKARESFSISVNKKYNEAASLYYVGHISQILEEYNEAKKAFIEIIKIKNLDLKLEQVAKFQMTEVFLTILRNTESDKEKAQKEVSKKILPMFKASLDVDKSSNLSLEIEKRIKEVQKEFDLDPDMLANGRKISSQRFHLYFDLKTKFDDNVTNTNLENDVQQSHKESYYVEGETEAKYDYVLKKRFILSPSFRINFNKYSNQDQSDVYQNDATILDLSVNNKYEHKIKDQPASLLFNLSYVKNYKDYKKNHERELYSTATTLTLGESCTLNSFGDTSFKFKYKNFEAYSESLNNHTKSFSIDQSFYLKNSHLFILLLEADLVDNFNNDTTNTDSYMLRFDYIIPEILPKYTMTLSLTNTLTDTKNYMSTRGYETTVNPSIEISKDISEKIKGILNIDFSQNFSKSDDYKYHKFVTNLELKYTF